MLKTNGYTDRDFLMKNYKRKNKDENPMEPHEYPLLAANATKKLKKRSTNIIYQLRWLMSLANSQLINFVIKARIIAAHVTFALN